MSEVSRIKETQISKEVLNYCRLEFLNISRSNSNTVEGNGFCYKDLAGGTKVRQAGRRTWASSMDFLWYLE